MKIVIEISDTLKDIADNEDAKTFSHIIWQALLMDAIKNGIPLPKGHGRLIDADYLKDVILLHSFHGSNKYIVPYSDRKGYRLRDREVLEGIINAPTIIEADGGDTE